MGLVIRKRINLGQGFGLNASRRGISSSLRMPLGSIGSRGYSVRSGIPGVYYRGSWKKSGCIVFLLPLLLPFFILLLIIL
jgi:hypothetical protein